MTTIKKIIPNLQTLLAGVMSTAIEFKMAKQNSPISKHYGRKKSSSVQCCEPDISIIDLTPRKEKPRKLQGKRSCKCPHCDVTAGYKYLRELYPHSMDDKPSIEAAKKKYECKFERNLEVDENAIVHDFFKNQIDKG